MDFVREHRNGIFHDELSDALRELVDAVATESKAGSLTVTISIRPAANVDGAVVVSDKIVVKPPVEKKSDSIFFVTPENGLIRDNPRQPRLPLREVADQPKPRELSA
jgi:hypothetical protein